MRRFLLLLLIIVPVLTYGQKKKLPYNIVQSANYSDRAFNEIQQQEYQAAIELATQAIHFAKSNYDAYLARGEAELYSIYIL